MTYTKISNTPTTSSDESPPHPPPPPLPLPDTTTTTSTTTPTTTTPTRIMLPSNEDDDDRDIPPSKKKKDLYAAVEVHDIDHKKSTSDDGDGGGAGLCAYWRLLLRYPMYRAYLVSHFCQNLGDWFVRIASILVVEEFSNTGQTIANLTLSVLLPKAIFSQVGGVLADRYDRRQCMIFLDCLSGVVVLGYLLAIDYKSLNLMYAVTILRSTLSATYYPISTGMCPLLFPNSTHDLQLAVTLNSMAWGITSIIGGLVAGALTAHIGFVTCYWVDCITFFFSAAWMYWGTSGNFSVVAVAVHHQDLDQYSPAAITATSSKTSSQDDDLETPHPGSGVLDKEEEEEVEADQQAIGVSSSSTASALPITSTSTTSCQSQTQSILTSVVQNIIQVCQYLWICGFGLLVFQKCTASFIWGIEDIVGAKFTTVFDGDGSEEESLSSWHMGCLFSAIGAGCMTGPALVNLFTDARYPHTLQRACWIAYCLLTLGWLLIGTLARGHHAFVLFLVFTFVRTMGSGTAWVNSTLLLQTLVEPTILGRVLAVEYTLMTLLEASSATMSGHLYDAAGLTKNQLALFGAFLGTIMVLWWGIYYWIIQGAAANPEFSRMDFATTTMVAKRTSIASSVATTEREDEEDDDDLEDIICCHSSNGKELQLEMEMELPEIA